jgi:thiol:disulfide interchange protein DsbC
MHPNGDEVHKIWGDGYYITLGDHNISIGVDDGQLTKKLNITGTPALFFTDGNRIPGAAEKDDIEKRFASIGKPVVK